MADALSAAQLDEIERAIGKSALGPVLTLAKLVAMARQGVAPEPEYTREEMREACRNNYHAGAAVGADLAAQVAQLRADVAAMGNALADYFDNGSDYSTGAKVRAIAERQGAKNG